MQSYPLCIENFYRLSESCIFRILFLGKSFWVLFLGFVGKLSCAGDNKMNCQWRDKRKTTIC